LFQSGYLIYAGGGNVYLERGFSLWDARKYDNTNPDWCKIPYPNPTLYEYMYPLSLLLHEGRHCEPNDPRHIECDGLAGDHTIEDGNGSYSGYSQAALYLMWVYKYGLNDPADIKQLAKNAAINLLNERICYPHYHSNPKVQIIIDELI